MSVEVMYLPRGGRYKLETTRKGNQWRRTGRVLGAHGRALEAECRVCLRLEEKWRGNGCVFG